MQEMNQQKPPGTTNGSDGPAKKPGFNSTTSPKPSGKDYIEFEEIK